MKKEKKYPAYKPILHQYLQKHLSWLGDANGGMSRTAQRRSAQQAGAALAQIRSPAAVEPITTCHNP